MGQVLGLNLVAVYQVMASFGVPPDQHAEVLDKVNLLHGIFFPVKKKEEEPDGDHSPESRQQQ